MSTAYTHPREKLGKKLGCALSYLTTAPAAPEVGTWNLGNEARGVKFVSAARAQGTERWSSFFSVRLAHSYTVLVPCFVTYINSLSLFSCGPVKHPILTPAREKASAPLVGQEPAGTQLLSYGQSLTRKDNICKGQNQEGNFPQIKVADCFLKTK